MTRWIGVGAGLALCLGLGFGALRAKEAVRSALPGARGALGEFDAVTALPVGEGQAARFVLGDFRGFVHVYEARGASYEEIWTSQYLEGAIGGTGVADMDADDVPEIVVFTEQGRLYFLDGSDFHTVWSNPPNEYERITALTIHNIDEDEQLELVFCADGRLIIYDGQLQFEEWRSDQSNLSSGDILVADVDGDGADEIVLSDGYVFDARFRDLEWQSPESFGQHLGVIDLDNDGIVELVGEFGGRFVRIFDIDLRREKSPKR